MKLLKSGGPGIARNQPRDETSLRLVALFERPVMATTCFARSIKIVAREIIAW
jgi:hypothetical protein